MKISIFNKSNIPLFILVAIMSTIIFFRYQPIFENLSTTKCAGPLRDGIKTFTNIIYHAKHSDSYTWFKGMNYPYEEHIMAATELPGFAILFKFLNPIFPGITDYTFGIIHVFLLLSILLCAVFLCLIFKEFGIPAFLSIPFTIAITFLAPQNLRFAHHIGLAPLFVLPGVIYLLYKNEKNRHWKYAAWLGLLTFISSFFHFYFFAIIFFFVSFYYFYAAIEKFNFQHISKLSFHYFLALGIPLLFFLFWMILNDKITDRTPNPYGFFVYHSNRDNIFLSPLMPLTGWLEDHFLKLRKIDFEGWAYIGLIADLFIVVTVVKWFSSIFKNKLLYFFPDHIRPFIVKILFAGGIMAYLSCSQPFIMVGWEHLLEYTGPYKQFRSTGRFAWAFYFAINIVAFTGFYYLCQLINNKRLRTGLLIIIVGISIYEAYIFNTSKNNYNFNTVKYAPDLVPGKRFTDLVDIDFSKYQAIIPIPLYLVGSANVVDEGGAYTIQQSLVLSAQTGLPVTGAMLTRSSRSQAYKQMQLVSEPYRIPLSIDDFKNDKPLLLLDSHIKTERHKNKSKHIYQESELIYKSDKWSLYEMELEDFQRRIDNRIDTVESTIRDSSLFETNGLLSNVNENDFIYKNFDDKNSNKKYLGAGGFQGIAKNENIVFKGKLPKAKINQPYSMTAWLNIEEDKFAGTIVRVSEILPTGELKIIGQKTAGRSANVFDSNYWVLTEIPFSISNPESEIQVLFKVFNDRDEREIYIDELLIKRDATDLYQKDDKIIWWNNRHYFIK